MDAIQSIASTEGSIPSTYGESYNQTYTETLARISKQIETARIRYPGLNNLILEIMRTGNELDIKAISSYISQQKAELQRGYLLKQLTKPLVNTHDERGITETYRKQLNDLDLEETLLAMEEQAFLRVLQPAQIARYQTTKSALMAAYIQDTEHEVPHKPEFLIEDDDQQNYRVAQRYLEVLIWGANGELAGQNENPEEQK